MIHIMVAGIAGAFMALQGVLNSGVGKAVGMLKATFAVHLAAITAMVPLLLIIREASSGKFTSVKWFYYLGGPLNIAIVYFVAWAVSRIGACRATTAIITCQVLTAAALDHFGVLGLERAPFHPLRLAGVGMLSIGAWLLLRK
ncbi:MAG: DMT family transporter [Firmicutes bacterium]|nr:DMT family transporter [Bacillota bacterium]